MFNFLNKLWLFTKSACKFYSSVEAGVIVFSAQVALKVRTERR